MGGGAFLDARLQKEFGRFVEARLHGDHGNEEIRDRNREIQRERFGTVALPYYAVADPTGEKVYWTGAGVIDADDFLEGLRKAPEER
jgi:hypothetical protein